MPEKTSPAPVRAAPAELKASLKKKLAELVRLPGPPGAEGPVIDWLRRAFLPVSDAVEVDRLGNLYAWRRAAGAAGAAGGARPLTLMLAAHADEVGLVVRTIDERGFIRFEKLGGMADIAVFGRRVLVQGQIPGVVGMRSAHLTPAEDRDKAPNYRQMYIDVGAGSAAAVEAMGIGVGDPVTFAGELQDIGAPGGDIVTAKAIDNRIGCAVALELFEALQGSSPAGDVCVAITVQEEVGLRGAAVAAFRVNPDYALSLDVVAVGDTPDAGSPPVQSARIGAGPALVLASEGGRAGLISHPRVRRYLEEAAARAGVPYQKTLTIALGTTDASAIHLAREGIPSGNLSIPRRYAHTPIEVLDLNDPAHTVLLLREFVAGMAGHAELGFLS
jgi:endoglucanase